MIRSFLGLVVFLASSVPRPVLAHGGHDAPSVRSPSLSRSLSPSPSDEIATRDAEVGRVLDELEPDTVLDRRSVRAQVLDGLVVEGPGARVRSSSTAATRAMSLDVGTVRIAIRPRLSERWSLTLELEGTLALLHTATSPLLGDSAGEPLAFCASESSAHVFVGLLLASTLSIGIAVRVQDDPFHFEGDGFGCLGDPRFWTRSESAAFLMRVRVGPASLDVTASYERSNFSYDLGPARSGTFSGAHVRVDAGLTLLTETAPSAG